VSESSKPDQIWSTLGIRGIILRLIITKMNRCNYATHNSVLVGRTNTTLSHVYHHVIHHTSTNHVIYHTTIQVFTSQFRDANIESEPVWDTSCQAEQIYDFINRQFLCGEVSQTGDDSIFPPGFARRDSPDAQ